MYVSIAEAAQHYGVCPLTIRRWQKCLKIDTVETPGKRCRYWIPSNSETEPPKRYECIYARVSTSRQKDDLDRQISHLLEKYPNAKVFSDVSSALNFKRPGLNRLLDEVSNGKVSLVVCSFKDRMARFGFDLIRWICDKNGVEIVIDNQQNIGQTLESELVEDLLACTHSFSGKLYSMRSRLHKP
jgi:putative resolvase